MDIIQEICCVKCKKHLLKSFLIDGYIEITCECGFRNVFAGDCSFGSPSKIPTRIPLLFDGKAYKTNFKREFIGSRARLDLKGDIQHGWISDDRYGELLILGGKESTNEESCDGWLDVKLHNFS